MDVEDTTAYSCGDRMGGGKKGEPGDGKGDEEMDRLLTATVREGVVVSFVSGLITAEEIGEHTSDSSH